MGPGVGFWRFLTGHPDNDDVTDSTARSDTVTYASAMDFRVLGSIEVFDDDRRLNLGGPKQRTVLALLVVANGAEVGVDSLIAEVYGEDAAPSTRRTIHTYVSSLRHELGDLIVGRRDSYQLSIEPTQIDAVRFERLYEEGASLLPDDPESASSVLREALGTWRGHAYLGIESGPQIDAEIRRLDESRLSALEKRIDADLALGLHDRVVGELEALVAEYPLRERHWAQLMLALYRSDRQSDALRTYTRARNYLGAELGIEPGVELQGLEQRILDHDPSIQLQVRPNIMRLAILVSDLPDQLRRADTSRREAVLARLGAILDAQLSECGGAMVGLRGTALYASTPSVADALEIARSLSIEGVTVAVDYGDVEVRGDNVSGAPVGRSARLVATSHPGQVILSEQAQAALNASGTAGWSVRSLGRHRLHGVDHAEMIYQAMGPDLGGDFPALMLDRLPPPVPAGPPNLAGYELRDRRSEQEYGPVYRAYQHSLGREVSVLVFHQDLVSDPRFVRRFESEAHRLVQLEHPHLVPLIDFWREPDRAVIVYRSWGEDLGMQLGRAFSFDRIMAIVLRVGSGLAHAHERGTIHGALSPSSILLDEEGNPAVGGLGLASMVEGIVRLRSDEYTAPEVLNGELSPAADVYALGAIAVELLSGRPLPRDRGLPSIEGQVGRVIARAVDPDPSSRIRSMREFIAEMSVVRGWDSDVDVELSGARNPYKGLNAFIESDGADFFGRDDLTDELTATVESETLTVVVGPSGIGKSSVVRAGLVTALRNGALASSEDWLITDMFPGVHPFEELAAALSRVALHWPSGEIDSIRDSSTTLADACARLCAGTVVLVIDQLEELFTLTDDVSERDAFLAMLAQLAGSQSGNVRVVCTLRADYFDRPLEDPDFGKAIRERIVAVQALSITELEDAVRKPAEAVGVSVDPDLVAIIAQEAAREPGGLPLLQHTMTELFERRSRDRLTVADYRESGGLVGSIGRRAERIYTGFPPEARAATRDIFLRLVTVTENAEDSRRRVRQSELERLPVDVAVVHTVLEAFGRHRLLTFDRDPATRGPTIEVAHEAILREWDRLAGWIDAARDDLLMRRRVDSIAREWDDSGRESSYLLGGSRLELIEAWLDRTGIELTDFETDFLVESRRAVEAQRVRHRRTRLRVLTGLGVALVVISVLVTVSLVQGRAAERRALETRVAELTNEALQAMDQDPQLAILLALEAYDGALELGEPSSEVLSALRATAQDSKLERVIEDGLDVMAVSPNGKTVALPGRDNLEVLRIYDLETSDLLLERRMPAEIISLAYDPDGTGIVVGFDPLASQRIAIVDTTTLETREEIDNTSAAFLSFNDDGRFLTGWDPNGQTLIWDVEDGYAETRLEGVTSPGVFVGETSILARAVESTLEFIDAESLTEVGRVQLGGTGYERLAASPRGDLVAAVSWEGDRVEVVSFEEGRVLESLGDFTSPQTAAFSTDGSSIVVGDLSPVAQIVDLTTLARTPLPGHGGGGVVLGATDDRFLVQSLDQGLRVWRDAPGAPGDGSARFESGDVWTSAIDPQSERAAAIVVDGSTAVAQLVDIPSGETIRRREFLNIQWGWPVLSPQPGLVAGLEPESGVGVVMNLATGEELLRLNPCEVPVGLSQAAGLVAVREECMGGAQPGPEVPRSGLVSLEDEQLVLSFAEPPQLASIGIPGTPSEDLALVSYFHEVQIWRISNRELVGSWRPPDEWVTALPVEISHDGGAAYVGHQTGHLVAFDVAAIQEGHSMSEAIRFQQQAHPGALKFLAAAGDSIITSGAETKVWDHSGRLRYTIETETDAAVAMTPDGSAVYFEAGDGLMQRTPIGAGELAKLARSRVDRDFTEEECLLYFAPAECPKD